MSDQMTWWAPVFKGNDTPSRSMVVPWRREGAPTEKEYRDALVERIDELVQVNRKESRWALDVEFEEICTMEERENWALHIGLSPQMKHDAGANQLGSTI